MSKPRKRNRRPKVLHVEPAVQIVEPVLTETDVQRIRETDGAEIDVGPLDTIDKAWFIGALVVCAVILLVIAWKLWHLSHS